MMYQFTVIIIIASIFPVVFSDRAFKQRITVQNVVFFPLVPQEMLTL